MRTNPPQAPAPGNSVTRVEHKIDALTALRFLAAILVVLYHRGVFAIAAVSPLAARPAQIGFIAVGFFYTLSGFVLTIVYAQRKMDRATFYFSRFARIYPLYLLALVLSLPGYLTKWHSGEVGVLQGAGALILAPLLLQAWYPPTTLVWNGPGWSLSCEAFFYFIFPFLLPRFLKLEEKSLLPVVGGCWMASLLPSFVFHLCNGWTSASVEVAQAARIPTTFNYWMDLVSFHPLARTPEFLAGMAIGCLLIRERPSNAVRKGTILVAVSVALLFTTAATAEMIPASILHNGLLLPVWLMLITGFYWGGFPGRLLSVWPLVALGEISYAMYILQSPVSGYLGVALRPILHQSFIGQYPNLYALALYIIVLTMVSAFSYRYFEKPMRDFVNRRWQRARSRSAIPTTSQGT